MKLSDFDYDLPSDLIARTPAKERTDSRLLVLDKCSSSVKHEMFRSLENYLNPGDLLLLNDTRVIPARLYGHKETGGRVEILLNEVRDPETDLWDCLSRSSRPLKPGTRIFFDEDLVGEIIAGAEHPCRLIRLTGPDDIAAALDRIGHMPLPPYLGRDDGPEDRERYQTVYAREAGALAAPTAGLHFSNDYLHKLASAGVEIHYLTLHVGLGTFLPVRATSINDHRMHEERFNISERTAEAVSRARHEGRRIVAVGTTVTRTLEAAWDPEAGQLRSGPGRTDIFIYPGYEFKAIDALLTNFHLPQSTLLMLVSAFAGRESVMNAYREAIMYRYRFYSYGDCMLVQ
ncbi:MAG: tRNA preQ1(34) S-adenosylmethionine ribosyltransferase-isomerase QueA [Desulfuromonas sp.]|nr:MAG: tRNA preQ1(34) S-adenosylmethionine ribosyltransferase-isomerase QueA [Desulfuromonas sp.]